MRCRVLIFVLAVFFAACRGPASIDDCPGKGHHTRTTTTTGKRAEKGKKKQKDESKIARRFHLFRKNQAADKDAEKQDKGVFRRNDKKQKKIIKKRSKHPQMDLFPGGKPGK